jgi:hypothetical protein
MKKYFASVVSLMLLFAISIYAQDTTGNSGTGTNGASTPSRETGTNSQQQQGTGNTSMQNEDDRYTSNADEWSGTLSDELKLNISQRDSVRSILLDYQKQRAATGGQNMDDSQLSQFNSSYNDKIMKILEDNQVESYNTYNKSWWNDINSSMSNTDKTNSTKDKNKQY